MGRCDGRQTKTAEECQKEAFDLGEASGMRKVWEKMCEHCQYAVWCGEGWECWGFDSEQDDKDVSYDLCPIIKSLKGDTNGKEKGHNL